LTNQQVDVIWRVNKDTRAGGVHQPTRYGSSPRGVINWAAHLAAHFYFGTIVRYCGPLRQSFFHDYSAIVSGTEYRKAPEQAAERNGQQ
jgi:hypothetical protein